MLKLSKDLIGKYVVYMPAEAKVFQTIIEPGLIIFDAVIVGVKEEMQQAIIRYGTNGQTVGAETLYDTIEWNKEWRDKYEKTIESYKTPIA